MKNNQYEKAFKLLEECAGAMQAEFGRENLTALEREYKVMLIDLCKDIAFEFAEGIEPIK